MPEDSALGSIGIVADRIPRMTSPKLKSGPPGTTEGFYMLAAYSFNLMRKMEYLWLATKEFALRANPEVVRRLRKDNDELQRVEPTWEAVAKKEEELMLRLYGEIHDEYEATLKKLGGA